MDISSLVIGVVIGAFLAAAIAFILWQQRPYQIKPIDSPPPPPPQPDPLLTLLGQETGVDLLTEMVRIQDHYHRTQMVPEKAIVLIRDLLDTLKRQLDVQPIETFGTLVAFDPEKHKAHEYHKRGEPVWIVQPGWRQQGIVLKWPVVQPAPTKSSPDAFAPLTILLGEGTGLDMLTAISRLLYYYTVENQHETIGAQLLQKFLTDITEQTTLKPLAQIGEVVKFDPETHHPLSPCDAGDPVTVVQPGWTLEGNLLKPTVVQVLEVEAAYG